MIDSESDDEEDSVVRDSELEDETPIGLDTKDRLTVHNVTG